MPTTPMRRIAVFAGSPVRRSPDRRKYEGHGFMGGGGNTWDNADGTRRSGEPAKRRGDTSFAGSRHAAFL